MTTTAAFFAVATLVALTPAAGMAQPLARAYRAAGASDRFVLHLQSKTGHAFGEPAQHAALDWFVRWLKP